MRGRTGRATVAAAVASGGLLVAGVVSAVVVGTGGHTPARAHPAVAAPAVPAPAVPVRKAGTVTAVSAVPAPAPSYIATLRAATPYSSAPGAAPAGTLGATNPFGGTQVLAVVGTPDGSGWVHVELPVRPNGTTGWVRSADVTLSHTYYRVAVDLASHSVTVTDAGRTVLTTPAAVGSPSSPTPSGSTYLWELIRPGNPSGAYGPYIFGLALFSDTYATFNGGNAQIGMHGQDEPWSIGKAVSHGCVRLPDDVITSLAGMLPLGTPVIIR